MIRPGDGIEFVAPYRYATPAEEAAFREATADPLVEAFEQLEREVEERKRRAKAAIERDRIERQRAACPHDRKIDRYHLGGVGHRICMECGQVDPSPSPP